jgi:hypothetical protein
MNAASIRLLLAAGALALAVPGAAGADGLDPSIYDPGVPAGQVEHGVVAFTLTGSAGDSQHRRVEYWNTAGRWREQVTDSRTGELIGGRVHDATGTTWLQYKPFNGDPKVLHYKGEDSVPGAGSPAPYNRKLAETGLMQGTGKFPVMVTLQPLGPRTIAGFAGTTYEQLSNGQPGIGPLGKAAVPGSHVTLVLQDGTFQPLLREYSTPNGRFGTLVQREVLLSRETTPAARATVKLTRASFTKVIAGWRAKVRAAIKKQHKR